ncbi:MAG: alpha-galactosidase, partial [Acidimicrobiales bacterium]
MTTPGAARRATPESTALVVALSSDDVSLVIDLSDLALPAVVHWGPRLEGLESRDLVAIVDTGVALNGTNDIDVPRRLAVLPEQHRAWAGRPGLQGSRGGRNWSTRFTVDRVTLGGEPVLDSHVGGPGLLEVDATDGYAGLALHLEIELEAGGLVRTRATVTNTGTDVFTVDALTLAMPLPAGLDELLDFGGRWGHERVPQRRPLHTGIHSRENRRGRTGADSAHVLHAGTTGFGFDSGDIRAVHIAWSGNHVHYAEKTFTGETVLGGGELLLPGEVRIGTGESYSSPWVYFSSGVGLDVVARRFHHHLRARSRPVSTNRPVTLNVWEAVYFDHRLERLVGLAERAARVGVERYVLDDGWFGARRHDEAGLGDWVVSDEVWPQGLHPLIERVTGLGMQFGLWFEPEMVNPDSDLARAHPDWMMAARDELPVSSRHQQVLDLTVPGAYEHVKGQILALLAEYDISYVKWDHNRDLVEAGSQPDGGRPAVHAQTLAVYRLLDEIRAEHPTLEIESCSSGGARVDLGILERTDRVWVSDVIDPLERQHMLRWTTQLIPPEYLGSHISGDRSHSTGRRHDLSFRAGTAVFGHLGIEWDLTAVDEETLDDIAEWVTFYKERRHLLLGGDLVRVDTGDANVLVHGVVAPDRSEAVFALAIVGNPVYSPGPRVRFTGLDATTRYLVRPIVVGEPPSGLVAPAWWGDDASVADQAGARLHSMG